MHAGSVPLLLVMSDWLDLPLIWVYLAVCEAALRGVTSRVTQAMLQKLWRCPPLAGAPGAAGRLSFSGSLYL